MFRTIARVPSSAGTSNVQPVQSTASCFSRCRYIAAEDIAYGHGTGMRGLRGGLGKEVSSFSRLVDRYHVLTFDGSSLP